MTLSLGSTSMNSSLSRLFYDAGQEVAAASGAEIAVVLNQILNRSLGITFRTASGCGVDLQGHKTETFGTLIYTTSAKDSPAEPTVIPADALPCVIDILKQWIWQASGLPMNELPELRDSRKRVLPRQREFHTPRSLWESPMRGTAPVFAIEDSKNYLLIKAAEIVSHSRPHEATPTVCGICPSCVKTAPSRRGAT
jgi:hypothetical protein